MTTTNRIKFWRRQRGWTLQQLADAADTTRAQIDKLERGTRRLTVDWMVRLAKPLGCDPRSLMDMAAFPAAPPSDVIPVFPLRPVRKTAGGYKLYRATAPATVPRPYFLNGATNAYAVIVPDHACAPALRVGQTAFLSPAQKPRAEQPVCVTHSDQSCAFYIFIRRAKDKIHLRQTQPAPRIVAFSPGEIIAIAPVIGTVEK